MSLNPSYTPVWLTIKRSKFRCIRECFPAIVWKWNFLSLGSKFHHHFLANLIKTDEVDNGDHSKLIAIGEAHMYNNRALYHH